LSSNTAWINSSATSRGLSNARGAQFVVAQDVNQAWDTLSRSTFSACVIGVLADPEGRKILICTPNCAGTSGPHPPDDDGEPNRLWGQRRIQAELARLGFKVSARTVAKYMQ
jgi:hypothetical protein